MPRSVSAWWIMRTEIKCGDFHKAVETPPGIDFVGVSVHQGDMDFSTICIPAMEEQGIFRTDEGFTIDETTTVTLHFYRIPAFSDVFAEFEAFGGMVVAEMACGALSVCLTI